MRFKYVCIVALLALFSSCSSIEILNSWKSESMSDMKSKNILAIARTNDNAARRTFENELVEALQSEGFKASSSYKMFSILDPKQKISPEKADSLKVMFREKGYDAIVLTVVKEVQEFTKSVVSNDNDFYAGAYYYPRYYRGFYGYYNHPSSYIPYNYNSTNQEITTYTSANYVLETVVYDLEKSKEEQLVGIVTSKIKEPDNIEKISKSYVKKIISRLK